GRGGDGTGDGPAEDAERGTTNGAPRQRQMPTPTGSRQTPQSGTAREQASAALPRQIQAMTCSQGSMTGSRDSVSRRESNHVAFGLWGSSVGERGMVGPSLALEFGDLTLDHRDHLGVSHVEAKALLDQLEQGQAAHREDERDGWPRVQVQPVCLEHPGEDVELHLAVLRGVFEDHGPDRLPVVRQREELHRADAVDVVVEHLPQSPERLW